MIQAVRITQYRTKDGAIFSSRDDACRHEIDLEIVQLLRRVLGQRQISLEELELVAANLTSKHSPVIVMLRSPQKDGAS